MSSNDETRQLVRNALGLDKPRCILGDWNNNIWASRPQNLIWVRERIGNDYGPAFAVQMDCVMNIAIGRAALLGFDALGRRAVVAPDKQAQVTAGQTPQNDNPVDQAAFKFIEQSRIMTGLAHPTQPPSMKIAVEHWIYKIGNTTYDFSGNVTPDLVAPTAGNHYWAGVIVKPDLTLGVIYTTEQDELIDLLVSDIDAIYLQIAVDAPGSKLNSVWKITGDTEDIPESTPHIDMRQLVNAEEIIISDANVSNPPTLAELDAAFGELPEGSVIILDDNGAGANLYHVVRKGGDWWYVAMTKAT